jgi:MFS family permease
LGAPTLKTREAAVSGIQTGTIKTNIPARLDRLPWSRWHWLVVVGLGTVWILDGLEVTIVGAIAGRLTEQGSGLQITEGQIGVAAGVYVAGACLGALFFGYLTDRLGRKKLFLVTLLLYLAATVATAFAMNPLFFYVCRFFTGAGIGGEYAAINSAIDELIPARLRGRIDLIINGSFWLGTAFGAALSVYLLDENNFAKDLGWRIAFGLGAVLGIAILMVRRYVPESPRWMFIHGREEGAEEIVRDIEHQVESSTGTRLDDADDYLTIRQRSTIGFATIAKTAWQLYPKRFVLGMSLFVGQAFLYNAVFFTFALVLTEIMDVPSATAPWYLIPLAIGNFLGPLLLGHFFDTVGRRVMITMTYVVSGLSLVLTGVLFGNGALSATTLTALWCVVFFFASAGASAAYLTVSEIFPMETRAMAIAFFYAVGTGLGGIIGPVMFGKFIEQGRDQVVFGYYIGAGLMIAAGVVAMFLAVNAERRSLEDVAKPLTAHDGEHDDRIDLSSTEDREPAGAPTRT